MINICHCGKNKLANQIVCTACHLIDLAYDEEIPNQGVNKK